MTTATMFSDDEQRVTRIVVPPNDSPKARDGFVGWIAEGWQGDPSTGRPVWWVKLSDSQWGPMITAPVGDPGPPGPVGPPGSTAPHVPGATYTELTGTVVVNRTLWQCTTSHTAAVDGDGWRTPFEIDAVAGLWSPVNALPVETFHPYLANAAQPIADGTTPTHVYLRQSGTAVVNRFRFSCVVAAGNVALGVQRGTGGGTPAPSDTQAWFSGFTPAVATSDTQPAQEIVVPGGMVVYDGDFVIVSSDDAGAQFLTLGTTVPAAGASLLDGVSYVSRGDTTPPVSASGLSPATLRGPLVVGRP